jgi:hypothetical protein
MAVGSLGTQTLAPAAAAMGADHIGLSPGLVDEHQTGWGRSAFGNVATDHGAGRYQLYPARRAARFFLKLMPSGLSSSQIAP